jgi:DNA-binding CsgD family transcriptional regulator
MIERKLDLLRESVAVAEASPGRTELASSLTELGAALRRGGERRAARDPLRRALAVAHACGAERLVTSARAELLAAGGRPRRFALAGADSLTATERRVARLAADGLANREIAGALFIATRTVEMHLTNAYRKLAIRSRDELPDALGLASAGRD